MDSTHFFHSKANRASLIICKIPLKKIQNYRTNKKFSLKKKSTNKKKKKKTLKIPESMADDER